MGVRPENVLEGRQLATQANPLPRGRRCGSPGARQPEAGRSLRSGERLVSRAFLCQRHVWGRRAKTNEKRKQRSLRPAPSGGRQLRGRSFLGRKPPPGSKGGCERPARFGTPGDAPAPAARTRASAARAAPRGRCGPSRAAPTPQVRTPLTCGPAPPPPLAGSAPPRPRRSAPLRLPGHFRDALGRPEDSASRWLPGPRRPGATARGWVQRWAEGAGPLVLGEGGTRAASARRS